MARYTLPCSSVLTLPFSFFVMACGQVPGGESSDSGSTSSDATLTRDQVCSGVALSSSSSGNALCLSNRAAGFAFKDHDGTPVALSDERSYGSCSDPTHTTRESCEKANTSNVWSPTLGTHERLVPNGTKDFEKVVSIDYTSDATRLAHRNSYLKKYTDPTQDTSFPSSNCGTSGSLEARVRDCNTMWVASKAHNAGGHNWSLVTLIGTKEVWRDEGTGLIWSDNLGTAGHCPASGNNSNNGFDCSANTTSYCAEVGLGDGVSVALNGGDYHDEKGGMGLESESGKVLWRLPTREDFLRAYANGAYHVLPNAAISGVYYWTSTIYSAAPARAWYIALDGPGAIVLAHSSGGRGTSTYRVRCVGR